MTTANPELEARMDLIQANRSAIYLIVHRAASRGTDANDTVVVIAGTTDPIGIELANVAVEKADLNLVDRSAERAGQIRTMIVVVPLQAARALLNPTHSTVAAGLDRPPPPGHVRCVAVAAGGATLVHADIRPMAPIADA